MDQSDADVKEESLECDDEVRRSQLLFSGISNLNENIAV